MRTLTTILSVMLLAIASAVAYADDAPIMSGRDVGTELYISAFAAPGTVALKDFSRTGHREELMEIGTALYHEAFVAKKETSAVRGYAAGGVSSIDRNQQIWDTLMGPVGGSDLP